MKLFFLVLISAIMAVTSKKPSCQEQYGYSCVRGDTYKCGPYRTRNDDYSCSTKEVFTCCL